jgi:hypothetical protein
MTDSKAESRGLSDAEIADQQATDLPDREAMSLLDVVANLDLHLNLAAPIAMVMPLEWSARVGILRRTRPSAYPGR